MKPTEKISVIDVGSNTLRLLIGNIQDGKIDRLYSDRVVTKLGRNFLISRRLNIEAYEKSIDTILKFKVKSEFYGANLIIPVGTGVLREAEDAHFFSEEVYKKTGLKIKIISGDEEAFYTLEGIKEGMNLERKFIAIDVGGGSTEWIYENGNDIIKGSLNIGTLKSSIEIKDKSLLKSEKVKNFREKLQEIFKSSLPTQFFDVMVITGGTAVTLAMVDLSLGEYISRLIHGHQISRDKLKVIYEKIMKTPISNLKNIVGISQDRLDTIIPGVLIIESLADFFNVNSLLVSDYGLIEGVMKNYKFFCYN